MLAPQHQSAVDTAPPLTDEALATVAALMRHAEAGTDTASSYGGDA